jgi:hypothetical protein
MDDYFNEKGNPIPFLQSDGFQYHHGPVYAPEPARKAILIAALNRVTAQKQPNPYEPTPLSEFEF